MYVIVCLLSWGGVVAGAACMGGLLVWFCMLFLCVATNSHCMGLKNGFLWCLGRGELRWGELCVPERVCSLGDWLKVTAYDLGLLGK